MCACIFLCVCVFRYVSVCMFLCIYLWMFLFVSVCEEKMLTSTVDHQHIMSDEMMRLKRNNTYHSVIRFAGKRAAIRMLAPDIENSRAKKLLCTHQLEISGPHKVFFVEFDGKLRGRAFSCTAIFFSERG